MAVILIPPVCWMQKDDTESEPSLFLLSAVIIMALLGAQLVPAAIPRVGSDTPRHISKDTGAYPHDQIQCLQLLEH